MTMPEIWEDEYGTGDPWVDQRTAWPIKPESSPWFVTGPDDIAVEIHFDGEHRPS